MNGNKGLGVTIFSEAGICPRVWRRDWLLDRFTFGYEPARLFDQSSRYVEGLWGSSRTESRSCSKSRSRSSTRNRGDTSPAAPALTLVPRRWAQGEFRENCSVNSADLQPVYMTQAANSRTSCLAQSGGGTDMRLVLRLLMTQYEPERGSADISKTSWIRCPRAHRKHWPHLVPE